MKKIIILLLLIPFNCIFSHDQSPNNKQVHQRIIYEAYKLLKLQFSKELEGFGDFDDFVGNANLDATDVSSNSNQTDLNITTNPASDYIEISRPPSEKRGEHHSAMFTGGVSIFDILGVEQFTLTPTLSLKGEGVRIDISGLSPGLYFVRFGDEVKKFVKV